LYPAKGQFWSRLWSLQILGVRVVPRFDSE
jgi:hypothetical protein